MNKKKKLYHNSDNILSLIYNDTRKAGVAAHPVLLISAVNSGTVFNFTVYSLLKTPSACENQTLVTFILHQCLYLR